MFPNRELLIASIFGMAISSGGFFFAQFSRSTRKAYLALKCSGGMLLIGAGALAAALII